MKSVIITKWIEPYKLLETIKQDYDFVEFIFNGSTKLEQKEKFFDELCSSPNAIGLYMKNVNKYYVFSKDENFDMWQKLTEIFEFTNKDYEITQDIEKPFNMVDMGKAEAGLIFP